MSENDKPEFRKTILIGLGGAGQQIVLRTKRFFLDTYGVVPPSVKILCLDTDDEALSLTSEATRATYSIEPSEFMHLKVDNPPEFIKTSSIVGEWFVGQVPVNAICRGAGAVRQNGRLAFFSYVNEIRRRIDKLFADLNDPRLPGRMAHALEHVGVSSGFGLSTRPTEIYVCGSVAGGTGSGTFLDIGLLLRAMEQNVLIHGFFLLPWVYRNKPFAYRVRQNAYAALAELDNLQSVMFGANAKAGYSEQFYPYQIRYADLRVEVDKAPYDLFHVIDGRNDHGENIDSVHELCEVVANAVFLSTGPMSVHVASVVDNLLAFLTSADPRIWRNRYARYSSLNVSSIHYPATELHRLVSASNALALCRAALRQVESGAATSDTTAADATREQARAAAERFITQENLHRSNVQARICPRRSPITFEVEGFEIADDDFGTQMRQRLEGEQKALEQALAQSFEGSARVFMDEVAGSLDQEIRRRADDPTLDRTQRREWGAYIVDHLTRLHDEVAKELVQATTQVSDLGKDAESLFEIAEKSRYIPLIGGHRKSAANAWAERVGELLTDTQAARNLEQEKAFYARLLKRLQSAIAVAVPSQSEIYTALLKTEETLQQQVRLEEKNLEILRNRPNHILLGHGRIVVLPGETAVVDAPGRRVKIRPLEEIACSYPQFVADAKIYSAERYLDLFEESPDRLTALFRDYCDGQLDYIKHVPVDSALETLAEHSDDPRAFKQDTFDNLFRLASPLWSFDRGRLSELQALQTDKIINIGFRDHDKDVPRYSPIAQASKDGFNISPDLAYSTTGDPQHIWMLCFAAAIPAYLLDGMDEAKRLYEQQITPTYHIDGRFEMNVPDLFPEEGRANRALRLLGMAIVKGIDVIEDEKLTKGHKFTFDDAVTRKLNFGDPIVWYLFRDMYAQITSNDSGLLDLLNERLKAKVASMDTADLRSCIERHIDKLNDKLARRDFSRLVSARLTYREIKALKDFLRKDRYAMNMDRYVAGTYVTTGHVDIT